MTNGAIYCNRCGAANSALAKFCANCGTSFSVDLPSTAMPAEDLPRPQSPTPQVPSTTYSAAPGWAAAPTSSVRYGGFWIRFVALIVDCLIVSVVVWPATAIIGIAVHLAGGVVSMPMLGIHLVSGIVAFTLSVCAYWLYEAGMESSSKQATLGKMALGLKVTDLEGHRISFTRATGRHFAKYLSGILFLGYIMAGFTERHQALHDMIAGTLVRHATD
jgi:uncharacterized RDD family membrane protein YckC